MNGADREVPDKFLIALRCFIMIDEWSLYIMLIVLWRLDEFVLFSITAILGAKFVFTGYKYYWTLLHDKYPDTSNE